MTKQIKTISIQIQVSSRVATIHQSDMVIIETDHLVVSFPSRKPMELMKVYREATTLLT